MNNKIMSAMGFDEEIKVVKEGKCPFCKIIIDTTTFQDEMFEK